MAEQSAHNRSVPGSSPGGPTSPGARRWLVALAPLLVFIVLTAIAARPVLTQLDAIIIGTDYDALINPWADMWTLRALREPGVSLWFTDYLFYPGGADLHYHSFSHLTTAVSLSLRPLFGTMPAYNLAVLLHLVLDGLAMYHLARYLTGSAGGGLLAGLVFAFNSHNMLQTSHPVLVGIWPLPWAALFLLQALERRDRRYALLAAGFVLLAALISTLMLILMALWLTFVLLYLVTGRRLTRADLPVLALFAIASAALASLPLLPLLRAALLGDNTSFILARSYPLPADVLAPFWPYWFGILGRSLHFGVVPLLLLIVSLSSWRRTWPWFLFLLVTYLFAIGPEPSVQGIPRAVTLPWSYLIPPLLRQPHRLNILISIALAVLVAFGWAVVARRLGRRWQRWLLALLLGTLIFAEYTTPPFPRRTLRVSAFYTEFLDDVPDSVAIAILPTGRQVDKFYMYYQTLHGHRMTGGVVSRPAPGTFAFIRENPLLRAGAVNWEPQPLPDDVSPALRQLAAAGVGYVVLDKPFFARRELDLEAWQEAMPVAPVYEDDLVVVYPTGVD